MPSIKITGLSELVSRLGEAATSEILKPPMHRSVLRLQRDMAQYPSPPAGSTYRRTGTLGRRWTTDVNVTAHGIRGAVGNNTPYAPWVQAEAFQAWMHRGRWQTDRDVLDDNEGAILADFARTVEQALGD